MEVHLSVSIPFLCFIMEGELSDIDLTPVFYYGGGARTTNLISPFPEPGKLVLLIFAGDKLWGFTAGASKQEWGQFGGKNQQPEVNHTFSLKSVYVFFWFYVHHRQKIKKKLKLIALNGDHNGIPSAPPPPPPPLSFCSWCVPFYVASIVIQLFIVSSVCVCQYKYFHFHFVSHIYCLCLAPCCFVLCGVHFVWSGSSSFCFPWWC